MSEINFLPKRYHEQSVKRRSQMWRILVMLLFGGVCAITAVWQYSLRKSIAAHLDAVQSKHAPPHASNQLFDRLQSELREVRAAAELYTYLQHPWPRTQILAEMVKPLPESITLTELQMYGQNSRSRPFSSRFNSRREENTQDESADLLPASSDLQELRKGFSNSNTIVSLTGHTTDVAQLHHYVAALGGVDLFQKAELISLEAVDDHTQGVSSQFVLRVIVRPGYGQPTERLKKASQAFKALNGEARR